MLEREYASEESKTLNPVVVVVERERMLYNFNGYVHILEVDCPLFV